MEKWNRWKWNNISIANALNVQMHKISNNISLIVRISNFESNKLENGKRIEIKRWMAEYTIWNLILMVFL